MNPEREIHKERIGRERENTLYTKNNKVYQKGTLHEQKSVYIVWWHNYCVYAKFPIHWNPLTDCELHNGRSCDK